MQWWTSFQRKIYYFFDCSLSKGFKIAHVNIQSLRYKVDDIRILLNDNNFDVLCLTETWLDNNIDDNEIKIDGYNINRLDRTDKQHGGILFYVKDGIIFKENLNLNSTYKIEALWIELNLPHTKPILVGTVYRPPDSKVEYLDNLDSIFQVLDMY